MSAPGNTDDVPAGCPRLADGGNGPRTCGLSCRMRLGEPGTRGPLSPRLRLVTLHDDTCARDVAARVRAHGVTLTFRELGILDGASRQSVAKAAQSGLAKLRRALGLRAFRELLAGERRRDRG